MNFMDENFMLHSSTARELFFNYAEKMPIFDYHCHLIPKEVAENKTFDNITSLWLSGDHYKWRAMRSCGIDEKLITGDSTDFDKFIAFSNIMPYLIGNPLYHWTHLELQRYFGITKLLCPENAQYIWDNANEQIKDSSFCVHNILKKFNVKFIGTTDSPIDDLKYHKDFAAQKNDTVMAPSFRPDPVFNIGLNADFINDLSKSADCEINDYCSLLAALNTRMDYFDKNGCKVSDCGLEYPPYEECSFDQASEIFNKALKGEKLSLLQKNMYKTHVLIYLGKEFAKRGWVMQLHMNVIRNNNTLMFEKLGADTGFDSIGDAPIAKNLSRLLNEMNISGLLPKTILYSLNPNDNYILGTMLGNFQSSEAKGKIQLGSGWWFNDQKDGMEAQLKCLANLGVLSYFVGMLTDSRSFLSYPRHEYFRRILCNLIGSFVENGEYPNDKNMLECIIKGISYNNAKNYF